MFNEINITRRDLDEILFRNEELYRLHLDSPDFHRIIKVLPGITTKTELLKIFGVLCKTIDHKIKREVMELKMNPGMALTVSNGVVISKEDYERLKKELEDKRD